MEWHFTTRLHPPFFFFFFFEGLYFLEKNPPFACWPTMSRARSLWPLDRATSAAVSPLMLVSLKNSNKLAISLPLLACIPKPNATISYFKLDVDPQRDDDASPMSTYRCMLRPTWMISAFQHKSKYKSNSISNFFEKKKIKFFGSHVVVLVKTFPLTYQLLM